MISREYLNAERKRKWAAQIAHGLLELHEAGLVHRDLRCENVVLDMLILSISPTEVGGPVVGHRSWTRKDPRSDVYSLWVTVWNMIHDGEDPLRIGGTLPIDKSLIKNLCLSWNAVSVKLRIAWQSTGDSEL